MKTKICKSLKVEILKSRLRGVAMVEALIAISILMVSVMAPLTLSTVSAKYARYGLYKITATSLAEEQIELMVNYKKSWDIYCFNNNTICANGSFDGFDNFMLSIQDPLNLQSCGISYFNNSPCYFDKSSFTYSGVSAPEVKSFTQSNGCKLYKIDGDVMKCNATSSGDSPTIYERKMYIESIDMQEAVGGYIHYSGIKLTSVVCIKNSIRLDCGSWDTVSGSYKAGKDAVTLSHYIYR